MKKIQILLSTYNGEKYLREQLDSYTKLNNFDDVKVLIRDDGSTDSTPEILREYEEKYGFEIILGNNLGLNRSMHELIKASDQNCKYFAFSDQDDIWLEDKLKRAYDALEKENESIPLLYSATSYLTDSECNILGKTFLPKKKLSFYNAMVQNVCIGHTQVINAKMRELLRPVFSDDIMIFDYWNYLLASAAGKVIYDSTPTTYYRQHGDNVIGYQHKKLGRLKVRLKRVTSRVSVKNAKQLLAFCKLYGDIMSDEQKKEAENFFKHQKNFFTRLKYCFITKTYRQTFTESIIFRIMYLFKRYNIN